MQNYAVLAVGILGLGLISSCSAGNRSFESRRQFAIQHNRERLASSKNEVPKKWSEDNLSALASINDKAVSDPVLTSAILAKGENGAYGIFVFWIEDYPSVDGIEFRLSEEGSGIVVPISDSKLKRMQADARDTIVFGMEYDWEETPETTSLLKSFEQIVSTKNLKVRLMRGNTPVTNWHPMSAYKVDRWLSEDK
jgi:hypothetical protein